MARNVLIQLRRATAANWTSTNPTLASGEAGYETDTGKLKIGDGVTAWTSLAYFGGSGGVTSLDSITGAVSLVAGSNVTITDNSPSAGDITIAASGGGGGGLVKLFESVLSGTAASIDTGANGIPSGHEDLLVILELQSNETGPASGANITFNGDTGANYDRQIQRGNASTASAFANVATTSMATALVAATAGAQAASTNTFAVTRITIPSYAATNRYKVSIGESGTFGAQGTPGNFYNDSTSAIWLSTAAINQITVTCATALKVFAIGSRMVVYGLQ